MYAVTVLIGAPIALIFGLSLHEFAHALVAYRLGDMTPVRDGRLTINPLAHFDPFGTILILLAGFGYGRPVMVNPYGFRVDRRVGMGLVAIAGPVTNVLIAIAFGIPLRVLYEIVNPVNPGALLYVIGIFSLIVSFNLLLAVFNMIPFPPLDGSKVLLALLPGDLAYSVERFYIQTQQYGIIVLFLLLWVGGRFIGPLIAGPANALFELIVGQPPIF
ncbi:MAG: site-2 protease family protein [Chloroflexi bacterium]|nr:site-2 protease family protein [Chloroflexota bacterium]